MRQDPKDLTEVDDAEQGLEVGEAGDALKVGAAAQSPEGDHGSAVGQDEIGCEEGTAIVDVCEEAFEAGSRRRHEEAAVLGDGGDRFGRRAVKERKPEDGLRRGQNAERLKPRKAEMLVQLLVENSFAELLKLDGSVQDILHLSERNR